MLLGEGDEDEAVAAAAAAAAASPSAFPEEGKLERSGGAQEEAERAAAVLYADTGDALVRALRCV